MVLFPGMAVIVFVRMLVFVTVVIMAMVVVAMVVVTVIVSFEQHDSRRAEQGQLARIGGNGVERAFELRGQSLADPDDEIRRLQHARIRGPHGEVVGRTRRRDHQVDGTQIAHHHRDQRLDRGDIGHNARHLCQGGCGDQGGGEQQRAQCGHGSLL